MSDRRNGPPAKAVMRLLPRVVLGFGLGIAALPGVAEAQIFGNWGGWGNGGAWGSGEAPDGMPPRQVRRSIAEQGFRVLSPLRRNGSVFVADVLDRRGRRERLIVAAADAQILQRFYLDDSRLGAPDPRAAEDQNGFASRFFGDNGEGLVPPAPIPPAGRRLAAPGSDSMPQRRFGDLDDGSDTAVVPTLPLREQPPIKTVKPRPRVVERTPDSDETVRPPGAVEAAPLTPRAPSSASKPRVVEPARAPSSPVAPPKVASRPDAQAPAATTPQAHRPVDPLAIPGGEPKVEATVPPVRSVSGSVTGAPPSQTDVASPKPTVPPKAEDVPVAPLD